MLTALSVRTEAGRRSEAETLADPRRWNTDAHDPANDWPVKMGVLNVNESRRPSASRQGTRFRQFSLLPTPTTLTAPPP
jgi:hypothetical protein